MRRGIGFAAAAAALFVTGAVAKPFKAESKTKYLHVEYSWSGEANAVPALVKRFTADMQKDRTSLTAAARSDATERRKNGYPFNPYSQVTNIATAGQSARLLSLRIDSYAFTGGAHGNSGTKALLWDRRLGKEVQLGTLFRPGSGFLASFRGPYCRALDIERGKRRQGEKLGGEFDQCPPFSDLALIPADPNRDGRFNRLLFVASRYVAGPYVEGEYEISLPLSPAQIAKLKPEYRQSFGT